MGARSGNPGGTDRVRAPPPPSTIQHPALGVAEARAEGPQPELDTVPPRQTHPEASNQVWQAGVDGFSLSNPPSSLSHQRQPPRWEVGGRRAVWQCELRPAPSMD